MYTNTRYIEYCYLQYCWMLCNCTHFKTKYSDMKQWRDNDNVVNIPMLTDWMGSARRRGATTSRVNHRPSNAPPGDYNLTCIDKLSFHSLMYLSPNFWEHTESCVQLASPTLCSEAVAFIFPRREENGTRTLPLEDWRGINVEGSITVNLTDRQEWGADGPRDLDPAVHPRPLTCINAFNLYLIRLTSRVKLPNLNNRLFLSEFLLNVPRWWMN